MGMITGENLAVAGGIAGNNRFIVENSQNAGRVSYWLGNAPRSVGENSWLQY